MTFPRYPEYKDSGVEWLGEVPAHWRLDRSDAHIDSMAETVAAGSLNDKQVFHYSIPVVQETGDGRYENGDEIDSSKLLVSQYQVLVSKLNPRKGTVCLAAPQDVITVCSGEFVPLSSKSLNLEFLLYLVRTTNYRFRLESMVESATRSHQRASPSDIAKFRWAFPPKGEQEKILAFLDHETARIDALVEEQQRLIELLKEKRQAVIFHAVTKGLDPDVPMKDSGVEWLGEVPAHWEVMKASYIGRLFGSDNVPEDMVSGEGDVPYLKVGSLSADSLEVAGWDWYVDPAISRLYRACSHYVVFPKRGAAIFLNKVNIVSRQALIDPNLMGWEIEGRYSAWYFAYALKLRKLDELADVSTVPQINNKHIGPERFPVPPIEEQEEIVSYLKKRLGSIDELVATSESGVKLLQERRSALISAAVTGKIDVRGWQPPAGSTAFTEATRTEAI